ncbi:organ-specific protein S2-like [Mercurialis annua]|uniref:organ-specific protein S2-like n=1 Tax=Mercurialis annua TaxID=3986 RepID=UPI002160636A|nr:organ-specific protein S2-like [Mercurialis annua]
MKSSTFITFFLFFVIANTTINARKDVGVNWSSNVTEDDQIAETSANYEQKQVIMSEDKTSFSDDFEPRPNLSVYHDDASDGKDGKSFVKDFEPRPNLSVYDDDVGLKEEKPFVNDFEPRPNLSVYSD